MSSSFVCPGGAKYCHRGGWVGPWVSMASLVNNILTTEYTNLRRFAILTHLNLTTLDSHGTQGGGRAIRSYRVTTKKKPCLEVSQGDCYFLL